MKVENVVAVGLLSLMLGHEESSNLRELRYSKPSISLAGLAPGAPATEMSPAVKRDLDNSLLTIYDAKSHATLVALGDVAIPPLERLSQLRRMPSELRIEAIELISEIGGPRALQALRSAILSYSCVEDTTVQIALFRGMARCGAPEALAEVQALSKFPQFIQPYVYDPSEFGFVTGNDERCASSLLSKLQTSTTIRENYFYLSALPYFQERLPDHSSAGNSACRALAKSGRVLDSLAFMSKSGSLTAAYNLRAIALNPQLPHKDRVCALESLLAGVAKVSQRECVPLSLDPDPTVRSLALELILSQGTVDDVKGFCASCIDLPSVVGSIDPDSFARFYASNWDSLHQTFDLANLVLDLGRNKAGDPTYLHSFVNQVADDLAVEMFRASQNCCSSETRPAPSSEEVQLFKKCVADLASADNSLRGVLLPGVKWLATQMPAEGLEIVRSPQCPLDRRTALIQSIWLGGTPKIREQVEALVCEASSDPETFRVLHDALELCKKTPLSKTIPLPTSLYNSSLLGALDEDKGILERINHLRLIADATDHPLSEPQLLRLAPLLESPLNGLRWEAAALFVKQRSVGILPDKAQSAVLSIITETVKLYSRSPGFYRARQMRSDILTVSKLYDAPEFVLELFKLTYAGTLAERSAPAGLLKQKSDRLGGMDQVLKLIPDPSRMSGMTQEDIEMINRCHRVFPAAHERGLTELYRFSLTGLERFTNDLKNNPEDHRPVVIVLLAKSDHNGALNSTGRKLEHLIPREYRVLCLECQTDAEADRKAIELRGLLDASKSPGAELFIINGHGNPQAIRLGDSKEGNSESFLIDVEDRNKLTNLGLLLKPGGQVILRSCSTGAQNGIVDNIGTFLKKEVFPHADTGGVSAPERPLHSVRLRPPAIPGGPWRAEFPVPNKQY